MKDSTKIYLRVFLIHLISSPPMLFTASYLVSMYTDLPLFPAWFYILAGPLSGVTTIITLSFQDKKRKKKKE